MTRSERADTEKCNNQNYLTGDRVPCLRPSAAGRVALPGSISLTRVYVSLRFSGQERTATRSERDQKTRQCKNLH